MMNIFQRKLLGRLQHHPEGWHPLFMNPNYETLDTLLNFHCFDQTTHLGPWIFPVLPLWEHEACEGNEVLAEIIRQLEQTRLSPLQTEDESLRPVLQRIRILASTPGLFPFAADYIQENLPRFLDSAEVLADLSELQIIYFAPEEIKPLSGDLSRYRVSPLSRRYVQNLFHSERREAILSVLASVAKNYPLLGTCRQAYAVMLSLENAELWGQNPFCLRLIANRFWERQAADQAQEC